MKRTCVMCHVLRVTWGVALALAYPGIAMAGTSYERTTEQLSQAVQTYRDLTKEAGNYDVVFRRDPMRPLIDAQGGLVTSAGLHGGLSVQGIIWSTDRPLAVIEDELFGAGDVLGPYTILQIREDGLIAQRGQDFLFIPLDRGLETQQERKVSALSLIALPIDVPVPMLPRRAPVIIESGSLTAISTSSK